MDNQELFNERVEQVLSELGKVEELKLLTNEERKERVCDYIEGTDHYKYRAREALRAVAMLEEESNTLTDTGLAALNAALYK